MIENGEVYAFEPKETLYYIFIGQDTYEDEYSFLNYSKKSSVDEIPYYFDSRMESDTTQTKFTYEEFQQAKKDLSKLWFGDEDDCLIPVGDLDG